MNSKKLIYVFFVLILGLLASCSGSNKNGTKDVAPAVTPPPVADTPPAPTPSSKDITKFYFTSPASTGTTINGQSITVTVPYNTNLEELTPTIVITGSSVSPASGEQNDFSNPSGASYTVKALDGTTKVYTVTVTEALLPGSNAAEILSFNISNQIGATKIDSAAHTVFVLMPLGTNLASLGTAITVSPGATVCPLPVGFLSPSYCQIKAENGTTKTWSIAVRAAGQEELFPYAWAAMKYVPGGLTCPTGVGDYNTATVANAYWMGSTEVTYLLWYTVRTWAETNINGHRADGGVLYSFANKGREGSTGTIGNPPVSNQLFSPRYPVTTISWRDAMVWTNAFTEWYNANAGTHYSCVYYLSDGITPIRISTSNVDNPVVKQDATGFRLPTSAEWNMASRYIGTVAPTTGLLASERNTTTVDGVMYYWTPGIYTSGAIADNTHPTETKVVAWYSANSSGSAKPVATRATNALGISDMSGNVCEWNFDASGSFRVISGGGWSDDAYYNSMSIAGVISSVPYSAFNYVGFRLARTGVEDVLCQ